MWSPRCVKPRAHNRIPGEDGLLFVPDQARTTVLEWGQSSKLACHLGTCRTLPFIRQRFYWPSLLRDVPEFIAVCIVCAQSQTPQQAPSDLLKLFPVPWTSFPDCLHLRETPPS
ncbi:hypothetical protein DPEC_G00342100 [Dallia pectoralis]|uniref:Uncharacterized protein n=1 Tax=Dallia pectoralis TaxID=75939 RepID=A0ACC2F5L4_DALPE|nr:hypothetical protein DPEC_G00342100 [Dallia pectoralis]